MSSIQDNRFFLLSLFALLLFIFIIIHIYVNIIIPQNALINRYSSRPSTLIIASDENENSKPPYRSNQAGYLPTIPTKGKPTEFTQIGILTNEAKNNTLPLYGRQLYTSSSKWNYYTSTGSFHSISIPIKINNRDCDTEIGCDELYTGDTIFIDELNDTFTVKIYKSRQYYYDPRI